MRKIIQLLTFNFLALIISASGNLMAQTDTSAKPEIKEASTYAPLIEFVSVQKNDNSVDLKTSVKAKINGTLTKLAGFKIEFTIGTDSTAKKLGEVITDSRGVAILNCNPDQLTTDKEGKLNFKASLAGKDSIESAEELVSVKRARLEITPVKEDSLLTVKVKLIDLGTGTEQAVPETDEAGEATIEIPNNLPGDAQGNITLLAKLDENEVYGNLEAAVTQPWGAPVSDELKALPRSLWSTLPPLWMPITFLILMTAVWGHYIVIIFELFRLRKEEPKTAP